MLSQRENRDYDTYDSYIVCAYSVNEAKLISPAKSDDAWCSSPKHVKG